MNWLGFNNSYNGSNNSLSFGSARFDGGNFASYGGNFASYGGNFAPNLNTQPTNYYAASFTSNNSEGFGFNNGNTGWGNRSNEPWGYYSNQYQQYQPQHQSYQPYDNFLINAYNPGYQQNELVYTRDKRRFAEGAIDSIGQAGFSGDFDYPRSLYGLC